MQKNIRLELPRNWITKIQITVNALTTYFIVSSFVVAAGGHDDDVYCGKAFPPTRTSSSSSLLCSIVDTEESLTDGEKCWEGDDTPSIANTLLVDGQSGFFVPVGERKLLRSAEPSLQQEVHPGLFERKASVEGVHVQVVLQ